MGVYQDFSNVHVYLTTSKSSTGESIRCALSGVISCYVILFQSVNYENVRVFVCTYLYTQAYTPRELCIQTYPNI